MTTMFSVGQSLSSNAGMLSMSSLLSTTEAVALRTTSRCIYTSVNAPIAKYITAQCRRRVHDVLQATELHFVVKMLLPYDLATLNDMVRVVATALMQHQITRYPQIIKRSPKILMCEAYGILMSNQSERQGQTVECLKSRSGIAHRWSRAI